MLPLAVLYCMLKLHGCLCVWWVERFSYFLFKSLQKFSSLLSSYTKLSTLVLVSKVMSHTVRVGFQADGST